MSHDGATGPESLDTVRLALRGWQQRIQAVIDIARDSDDLAVRLPVLDRVAHELVSDLERAIYGLDTLGHTPGATIPAGAEVLRAALGQAHARVHGIELWHRAPSVGALRKARDYFRLAADGLEADAGSAPAIS